MARPHRRRYLAFVVEGGPAPDPRTLEQRVLAAVMPVLPPGSAQRVKPRLFHAGPGKALLRVEHVAQAEARRVVDGLVVGGGAVAAAAVPAAAVRGPAVGAPTVGAAASAEGSQPGAQLTDAVVRTVVTSGTLRQARLALGVPAPKRPRRRVRGARSARNGASQGPETAARSEASAGDSQRGTGPSRGRTPDAGKGLRRPPGGRDRAATNA